MTSVTVCSIDPHTKPLLTVIGSSGGVCGDGWTGPRELESNALAGSRFVRLEHNPKLGIRLHCLKTVQDHGQTATTSSDQCLYWHRHQYCAWSLEQQYNGCISSFDNAVPVRDTERGRAIEIDPTAFACLVHPAVRSEPTSDGLAGYIRNCTWDVSVVLHLRALAFRPG